MPLTAVSSARRRRVVHRHRRVVDARDRDRHRRDVRDRRAVARRVGEAVGPVEVRRRRVGEAAVRVQRHRRRSPRSRPGSPSASCRHRRPCRSPARAPLTAVSSAVVAASLTATGASLTARDRDRHRRDVRDRRAVARRVGEAVRPVEVRRRRVGEAAVRGQRHGPVRRRSRPGSPSASCRRRRPCRSSARCR